MRPFKIYCGIQSQTCSKPLQRRLVDFAADSPFGQVNDKLREHYGIEIAKSTIRKVTYMHSSALMKIEENELVNPTKKGKTPAKYIVTETDGSMIPIVSPEAPRDPNIPLDPALPKQDRRKNKVLCYKEARLNMARNKNSKTPIFSATMRDVDSVGKRINYCVEQIGLNDETKIHAVGDGAVWISDQIEEQFGAQATYLIDFYHLCEYLSAAAKKIAGENSKAWMERHEALMKESKVHHVLMALRPHVEAKEIPEEEAPVRACYRYMNNRTHQLDYKTAITNDLPIGSGEIESAHRYVIQERLKKAGAWWLTENADTMLALRTARANDNWDEYWKKYA